MPVTSEQIRHIAALAHLNLNQPEITQLTTDLSVILDYVARLQQVSSGSTGSPQYRERAESTGREDLVRPSLTVSEALQNAPQREGDYFLVPRVIG